MSAGMLLLTSIILLLTLTPHEFALSEHECLDTWFNCGNGKCISTLWLCDGDNECGNWADEKDCVDPKKHIKCLSSQFRCKDGECIPGNWRCDGQKDCIDGDDEASCANDTTSCEDGFKCPEGECIPMRWKCDGAKDCPGGEDESLCSQNSDVCRSDEFSCPSGSCLLMEKVCDGNRDCSDGSDEGSHCVDHCTNSTCSQGCQSTPAGPRCFCNSGFYLTADNKTCDDLNECAVDGFCSHKCKNIPGGYSCSCFDGYKLENNSCIATGEDPLLVFSTFKEIRAMYLKSGRYFPVYKATGRCTAVDVDPTQSRVYWTELASQSAVYSVGIDGTGFKVVINNGLIVPEDVAVDYIARNIYVTDSGLKQVLVCRIDGSICSPLHKTNINKPRSLALDIPETLLYWTDWGERPSIQRSGLDGNRRTTLVSTNIVWPNGMVIDHTTNRLYWCDAKLNRIEYITLDGKVRKVLLEESVYHPYSLSTFEDKLYWTDWKSFTLESCNKFTGHEQKVVTRENSKRIMGVHVYHPVLIKKASNPCWMTSCSHTCVASSFGKYKCLCPPGFLLLPDGKSCIMDRKSPQMFVADKTHVYHMQPEGVGNGIITALQINHLENIADVTFNGLEKLLYISDTKQSAIIEVNLTSFRRRDVLTHHLNDVQSLQYDWLGKNLYFADTSKGTVEVYSFSTKSRSVVLSNLSRPIAIALDPPRGVMFVSEVGSERPHVDMYDMDGKNKVTIPSISGATVSLAIHPKKPWLFWSDQHSQTISSIDYFNPLTSKEVLKREVPRVTSISVSENFLYWMELSSPKVNIMQLNDNRSYYHYLSIPGSHSHMIIGKVNYIAAPHEHSMSACNINNGGCSHVCLIRPTGTSCNCPEGMKLSPNLKTCIAKKQCDSKEFKCVSNGVCLPNEFHCDGMIDCDDGSDERSCDTFIKCPHGDFECRNGHCITSMWKCDSRDDCGDNSDEENCPEHRECSKNKFACGNGQCVPDLWRCDREKDCDNGKDEEDCGNTSCKDMQLRCDNGQCIPISWLCDDTFDCSDNSDETPEKCGTSTPACLSDDFRCDNGVCIDHKLVCDHRTDCEDKSDEKNCAYNTTCKKDMFQCKDGSCIYQRDVCDGYADCDNDEHQNCTIIECSKSEFYCSSPPKCIPQRWLCDGNKDCGDGADEHLRSCPQTPTEKTPLEDKCTEYLCQNHQCLSWSKVCNGIPDCSDYSDEGPLCATSCGKTNGRCSQVCSATPQGPKCSCLSGYKLSGDDKACEDEDECGIPGMCSQFCNNTKGGFKCSCAEGYFLTQDNRKCKADGGSASLVYLLPDQIRGLDLHTHSQRVYVALDHVYIRGFDYDAESGVFFWSDWRESTITRYNVGTKRSDVMLRNLNRPYFIKWDWIARIMYFTNGDGKIEACSGDGEFCATVLSSNYRHISSLEIAPKSGVLFWTIWTDVRKTGLGLIERANMDGSGRIKIVTDKIYWPSALAIDNVLKHVYWADVKTNVIERTDYHGLNRVAIVSDGISYPYSMTLFEDYVYWADWGSDQFIRSNKFDTKDKSYLHHGDVKSESITIVHEAKQQKGVNRCQNSPCPQLCLPKPTGYTCRCDKKFELKNGQCVLETRAPIRHSSKLHFDNDGFVTKLDATVRSESTTLTVMTSSPLVQCDSNFCLNGGKCYILENKRRCECPHNHFGFHCEMGQSNESRYDYSWVVAVILGLGSIALIILVILVCRQNRSKLSKFSDNLAVTFRNPRYGFRKGKGLVMDTDDGAGADELMLGKKGAYTPCGFGNPVFNQRSYLDTPAEEGDYKRWPSYDSDDSAFVSEQQNRDEIGLDVEHAPLTTSKERIQFFQKR